MSLIRSFSHPGGGDMGRAVDSFRGKSQGRCAKVFEV